MTIAVHTDYYLLDDQLALPANTTTIVQGYPCGAPERIADKVLDRHVCRGNTLWALEMIPTVLRFYLDEERQDSWGKGNGGCM